MSPTPESNEKMIKKNRMMINKLMAGGIESRDLVKRPDGSYGGSIVKPGKNPMKLGKGKITAANNDKFAGPGKFKA